LDVYPSHEALSDAAARLFVAVAERAIAARDRFSVALSGGQTPLHVYELLAGRPFCSRVRWANVDVFWTDERCVPADDPRSNHGAARRALLEHVPIPAGQIHPIPGTAEPAAAARNYEALLRAYFAGRPPRLDLVLLGLGEDGHTASLFPDTPALAERQRWVADVHPPGELARVTLTAPLLNQAAVVAFIVAGGAKVRVLREVREGPQDPNRLPAQLIHPADGELRWLVDEAAASEERRKEPAHGTGHDRPGADGQQYGPATAAGRAPLGGL
jgi:6-phosphogluconolactonase